MAKCIYSFCHNLLSARMIQQLVYQMEGFTRKVYLIICGIYLCVHFQLIRAEDNLSIESLSMMLLKKLKFLTTFLQGANVQDTHNLRFHLQTQPQVSRELLGVLATVSSYLESQPHVSRKLFGGLGTGVWSYLETQPRVSRELFGALAIGVYGVTWRFNHMCLLYYIIII